MADISHIYYPAPTVFTRPVPDGMPAHACAMTGLGAGPVVCVLDGQPLLRDRWGDVCSGDGSIVFIHLPMDGGGDSDPLRMAAMIGVMALAFAVAPGMGAALVNGGLGPFGLTLVRAGIMMAGSLLVNAVMPVKAPAAVHDGHGVSSTYALSVPTNTQRIGQVIQVQYGRVMTTPPIISQPWSEYVENDEFVHILLSLGWGEFDVHQLLFDTLDFETVPTGLAWDIIAPGDPVPYHDNVFTSPQVSGQEITSFLSSYTPTARGWAINDGVGEYAGTWFIILVVETSNPNVIISNFTAGDRVVVNGSVTANNGREYIVDWVSTSRITDTLHWIHFALRHDSPQDDLEPWPPVEETQFDTGKSITRVSSPSNSELWPAYYNGSPSTFGLDVFCDIIFPNGLFKMGSDGVMSSISVSVDIVYQVIHEDGSRGLIDVLAGPFIISSDAASIQAGARSPRRYTISGTLPTLADPYTETDRFLIGLRKAVTSPDNTRVDMCAWAGLRVVFPDVGSYPGVTTIPVRAKASAGLNSDALSKIKVLSTRKLPIWDGSAWSAPTATRSIAWAAADACRNEDYSVGLQDNRVDLATLLALDAIWTARGDYCDGIFDTKGTFWDGLKAILRTGRAQPHMVGGSVTFTRDQAQAVIKGVFTPRNIIRGTFSLDYLLYDPDTPDDVVVEYLDSSNWSWASKTCSLPGSSGDAPATLRLWGVTDPDQAEREGLYEASCNMYRRTFVTFQTELDARVILRGHLVSVSHPLPSWGVSGEVLSVSGQIIELSEPVVFGDGTHYLSFRKKDGTQDGPYGVTAGDDDTHVVMSEAVPAHVYTGYEQDRTHFQFGAGDDFERRCLVISATPKGKDRVELLCVVEHDAVHTADQGGQ